MNDEILLELRRIADALERAYPKPSPASAPTTPRALPRDPEEFNPATAGF